MNIVKSRIVKIGNSLGVRIPNLLLEQSGLGLGEHVELEVQPGQIIIRAAEHPHPRQGWDEQFRLMAERADDRLLDGDRQSLTKWDEDQWEWS